MKPAPFRYLRAETVEHALDLLGEHGDDAKVLAGGQSLVAVMNLRLSRPEVVIDIDRVPGCSYVLPGEAGLRVGALTRHRHVERYPGPLDGYALLPRAARYVGHAPIRNRGTFGGSIAHADPAAEWPLVATLLDARIEVAHATTGRREVAAADFFHGFFTTAVAADELVTAVTFPVATERSAIAEFARRHGDFAVVSAAVAHDLDDDGRVVAPRLALGGVAAVPVRLTEAAAALEGRVVDAAVADEVGAVAAAEIADPPADAHGDATYRRHLVRTLVARALLDAARPEPT